MCANQAVENFIGVETLDLVANQCKRLVGLITPPDCVNHQVKYFVAMELNLCQRRHLTTPELGFATKVEPHEK